MEGGGLGDVLQGKAMIVPGTAGVGVGEVGVGEVGVKTCFVFFAVVFVGIAVADEVELFTEGPLVEVTVKPGGRLEKEKGEEKTVAHTTSCLETRSHKRSVHQTC